MFLQSKNWINFAPLSWFDGKNSCNSYIVHPSLLGREKNLICILASKTSIFLAFWVTIFYLVMSRSDHNSAVDSKEIHKKPQGISEDLQELQNFLGALRQISRQRDTNRLGSLRDS